MAEEQTTFGPQAVKQIGDTVRRVARMPQDRSGGRLPDSVPGEESFWARLTTRSIDGMLHSWMRVRPSGGEWVPFDPPAEGELNAVEANCHRNIPPGSIVRLTLIDFDAAGPLYNFQYEAPEPERGIPLHDHRDNMNGGFAFACFHPGTSLPQMPWAI